MRGASERSSGGSGIVPKDLQTRALAGANSAAKVPQEEVHGAKINSRRGIQMRKQSVRFFLLAMVCFSLAAFAQVAQVNITGGGTKGDIPVFKGAHAIGNSIAKQVGTTSIVVSAGGGSPTNLIFGNNTQTDGLTNGAGVYGQLSTTGESTTGSGFLFG